MEACLPSDSAEDLVARVRRETLPQYGFEGSLRGAQQAIEAIEQCLKGSTLDLADKVDFFKKVLLRTAPSSSASDYDCIANICLSSEESLVVTPAEVDDDWSLVPSHALEDLQPSAGAFALVHR